MTTLVGVCSDSPVEVCDKVLFPSPSNHDIALSPFLFAGIVGSPYWMAPEVIELAATTTKSDIWAVGGTVVELLTGRPPYFRLNQQAAMYRIVIDAIPPLPEGLRSASSARECGVCVATRVGVFVEFVLAMLIVVPLRCGCAPYGAL